MCHILCAGELADLPTVSAQKSRSYASVVKTECPSLTMGAVVARVITVVATTTNTTTMATPTTPAATDSAFATTVMDTDAVAAAASGVADMQTSHRCIVQI